MDRNKSTVQTDFSGDTILLSKQLICDVLDSSNREETLKLLLSDNDTFKCICQYLEYQSSFNKEFEALLIKCYRKGYVDALKKTIAFKDEDRFVFLFEKMNYSILEFVGVYFRNSQFDESFEKLVAKQSRKIFIKAIRSNRAFMDEDRLDFYAKEDSLRIPKEHLETWKCLKETENALWNKVEEAFESFKAENKKLQTEGDRLCSAMAEIVVWMERKRWKEQDKIRAVLQECYNLFVEKYFRDYGITTLDIKDNGIEDKLARQLCGIIERKDSAIANGLFEAFFSWVVFKNSVFDSYCYDMSIMPKKAKSGSLYLSQSPRLYYRWKFDECRYEINRNCYYQKSGDTVDEIQKSNSTIDEMDLRTQDSMIATSLLLGDLCLDKITWGGEDIEISKAFYPLIGLSMNRLLRYEKPLESYKRQGINSWEEAFAGICNEKGRSITFPFNVYTKDLFLQQTKEVGYSEDTANLVKSIFGRFCFRFNDDVFDRFKKRPYDVMSKPFLMIGKDTYFTPTMFLANNDWFYCSAEKVMEIIKSSGFHEIQENTAKLLEEKVRDLCEKQGWKAIIPNPNDNKGSGDVDIIVEDNETVLLIQLKRTNFRTNPSDRYLEMVNVDLKAAYQLETYPYKADDNKRIIRWYVTNSYENCLRTREGCTKVNYFDLIRLLEPDCKWNKLDDLIKYVTEDIYLKKELYNDHRSLLRLHGLISFIVQPHQAFNILIKAGDAESYERLDSILDKNKMDVEERLRIAEELSKSIPDDYRVWDALADIYTDKEEFGKAIVCCKRALKITGYDPLLLRNYAITLRKERESHLPLLLSQSEEERRVVKTLMDNYWFLDYEIQIAY